MSGRWWRFGGELRLDMIPLPRVKYENQGPDYHWVAFTVGTKWSDAIISVEVYLDGCQATRLVTTAPIAQARVHAARLRLLLRSVMCAFRSRPVTFQDAGQSRRPSGLTARVEERQNQACGATTEHSP